jgi:hypothetical protein
MSEKYHGTRLCPVWDAAYDPETGEWVEGKCGNPECTYCDRPASHPEDCGCLAKEDRGAGRRKYGDWSLEDLKDWEEMYEKEIRSLSHLALDLRREHLVVKAELERREEG